MSKMSAVLSSLADVDNFRNNPSNSWYRPEGSHLDLLDGSNSSETGEPTAICSLNSLLPFTAENGLPRQLIYEEAAAIALAAQHLNDGNGVISEDVNGLNERCPIRFTVEFADTATDPGTALNHVIESMDRDVSISRPPCAFIGAYRSSVSIPTSILTGIQGYPQISGVSTSADLDDKTQFPLFGRTVPSDSGNAVPIIQFMSDVLGIKYLAVLNINDAYGNSFVQGMRLAAEKYAPEMTIYQAPLDTNPQSIRAALQSVKATQYRYIFAIVFGEDVHDQLLEEAYNMELAGTGEHQWLFGDSFNGVENRQFEENSPLHLAYRGVGLLQATGGIPKIGIDRYDTFMSELGKMNNPSDLEYLNSLFPNSENFDYTTYVEENKVLNPPTADQATFLYEAALGLGLAACKAVETTLASELFLDGTRHYQRLVNSTFQGVTADIVFDPTSGTKLPDYTMYRVTNYVDQPINSDDLVTYEGAFTHLYQNGTWREIREFIFNDATSDIPIDIPPVALDNEVVTATVRTMALCMFALVLFLGVGFMWWTNKNRKARVVLASQPFFLHTICFGIILMASTIVPLTFDHGSSGINGCTIACNAMTWLFTLGFTTMISALFCKTHRVNRILNSSNKMQRITVTIWDVMKPMFASLTVNIVVLSLMSALGSPDYNLITSSFDSFGRADAIRGQCDFGKAIIFLVIVTIINFAALSFTLYEAFQARNLSTEFAESQFIFRALVVVVLVLFVGGPVLVLARDNANAFVFVASAIIFVSCTTILLLIFVPKMQYLKESMKKKAPHNVHISGVDFSDDSGHFGDSSRRSEPYPENVDDLAGARILTTKTAEQLLQEVEELKFLLARSHERRRRLQQGSRDSSIASDDISEEEETSKRFGLPNSNNLSQTGGKSIKSFKSTSTPCSTTDFTGQVKEIKFEAVPTRIQGIDSTTESVEATNDNL